MQEYLGYIFLLTGLRKVHINQTSGVIATPNYPNNYPNYMDCLRAIQLHPAMQIFLYATKSPWKKQKAARTSTRRYWMAILSPLPSNKDIAEFSIDLWQSKRKCEHTNLVRRG